MSEDLFGFVLWGTPSADDVVALVALLQDELDRPPHAALVDVRRLSTVLLPSYAALADYFRRHAEALLGVVTRGAIVKSDGLPGAVAAGFLGTVPKTFSATVWDELPPALSSLGVTRAHEVAAALDGAQAEALAVPDMLRALRRWLDAHVADGTLDDAAQGLATSARTLQRRLGEAKTSFAEEAQRARVRCARRLLVETDAPISNVAIDAGCATPQHLSTLFKKHEGMTPSEWRARHRRGI